MARQKPGNKLYKITKIKYRRVYDSTTGTWGDDFREIDRVISFRAHKVAVSQSLLAAKTGNDHTDRMEQLRGPGGYDRYGTIIEVADMPEFKLFE